MTLRPHNAGFDFGFPDYVKGLQALHADLALLRSAVLADPRHAIAGAAILALQPDGLADLFDPRRRHQARSIGGDLIGAAVVGLDASYVGKHLHGHRKMQPLFMAFIGSVYDRGCARRRDGETLLWFHDLSSIAAGPLLVNI